jgi:cyclic pyranopterin phosphate synthase
VIEAVEAALNVGDDLVEIVGPVGNEESCRYCYSVRVTYEGHIKACLDRNDDLRSMGEMTKAEIRETVREILDN